MTILPLCGLCAFAGDIPIFGCGFAALSLCGENFFTQNPEEPMFNCGFGKDAAGISFCSIDAYHQTVRLSELFHLVERRLTPYYRSFRVILSAFSCRRGKMKQARVLAGKQGSNDNQAPALYVLSKAGSRRGEIVRVVSLAMAMRPVRMISRMPSGLSKLISASTLSTSPVISIV